MKSPGKELLLNALNALVCHDSEDMENSFAFYCETPPKVFTGCGGLELVRVNLSVDDSGHLGWCCVERLKDLSVFLEARFTTDGCEFVGGQATICEANSEAEASLISLCRQLGGIRDEGTK